MKITEVSIHTRVKPRHINGNCDPMIGKIISEEVRGTSGGGQFQVLVEYTNKTGQKIERWVGGGNLVKIDF
jgi:hypothetical protein